MSWIVFASLSPFVWAFYNILDQYLVRKYFPAAGLMMLIFSSAFGTIIGLSILIAQPDALLLSLPTIATLILLGAASIFIFWPYIIAIQEDDSDIAVPIFQTIPVFVFIMGWLFLGETVSGTTIFAASLIIMAAIGMSFDTENMCFRRKTLGCMMLSSFGLAVYTVLLRYFAEDIFWTHIMAWNLIGAGMCAFSIILCAKSYRINACCMLKSTPYFVFIIFILAEILAAIAEGSFVKALSIAPSAGHVQTMNGLQPFFVLMMGALAYRLAPKYYSPTKINKSLAWKLGCLSIIFIGIYLLQGTAV